MGARETAAAVRAGLRSAREVTEEALAAVAARDGETHAFLEVLAGNALAEAAAVDAAVADGRDPGRWPACRWRSRTTCAPVASRRRVARRSSTAGARLTTPPSWRSCAPPVRSRWARRTWTSSPWAARRRTPPSGPPAIRATAERCRAGAAAVRLRPWRPGSRRSHSVPTPEGRSVSRPRCAVSSA